VIFIGFNVVVQNKSSLAITHKNEPYSKEAAPAASIECNKAVNKKEQYV